LTPAWRFAHKRARPEPVLRVFSVLSVIDGLMSASNGGKARNERDTGECPEWQRELTVNQPPHGFEGSSPSSPTSLRSSSSGSASHRASWYMVFQFRQVENLFNG
jgi:hypothetical protein